MKNAKLVPRGDHLFKEGDPAKSIYLIQSGRVSIYTTKAKKNIELYQASTAQVLGEEAVFGASKYAASAQVYNDAMILEVPVALMKGQLEKVNQVVQVFLNSLVEKIKNFKLEIRDFKIGNDTTPCPPDLTAAIFGTIFHTARYIGEKTPPNSKIVGTRVAWPAFKKYAQRIFNLSPLRCENGTYALIKMDLAHAEMIKDPTDPEGKEEIGFIIFKDLQKIEDFFEYYQNYHFKGGIDPNFLKPDDKISKIVEAVLKVSEKGKLDRNGVVWLKFMDAMDELKKYLGPTFEVDKFNLLEQKGLYLNRKTDDSGGIISFYKVEFEKMLENWKFLRAIERWNDDGLVDLNAVEAVAQAMDYSKCPSCKTETGPAQKFCAQCGLNLIEARAPKAA